MTAKVVEQRLDKLLKKLAPPKPITVQDIKEIIWNATIRNSGSLFPKLAVYAKDNETVQEIMQLAQDAWNYFPHAELGGKSPYALVTESQQTGKVTKQPPLPKTGKTFSDVFADQYPQKIAFKQISDDTWGWEFPKLYYELTEQLWELEESSPSKEKLEIELYRLIKRMPELFDAVNRLAQLYGAKREFGLVKQLYERTITAARKHIPGTFTLEKDWVIWAYMENRPFLLLLAGHAMFVEQFEGLEKAIPLYEEILAFNPNDNQGIRGLLATALLKANQPEKVIALADHYPEDTVAELTFGTVLARIMLDNEADAKSRLKNLKKWYGNVIKELLNPTHHKPLTMIEGRITSGGTDEAYAYWQSQGVLWQMIPGAMSFLKENTKDIQAQIISVTDEEVLAVPFFHDFLTFLGYLRKQPIKHTATGKISIKAIAPLLKYLKTMQPVLEMRKEYGWKIRTEDEAQPLHMLCVLADIMHLTRKQHDKLLFTKNGRAFLQNISPVDQYSQLLEHYWYRLNWGYISGYSDNDQAIAASLQRNQGRIWKIMAANGTVWIDYEAFCEIIRDELHLQPLPQESYTKPDEALERELRHTLFMQNLVLFRCVEVETKQGKYHWEKDIVRFRATNLGLAMFQRA